MDQENKQQTANTNASTGTNPNTNTNTDSATASNSGASGSNANSQSPTFDRLMQQSPKLAPFCGWLKCLRAPALSMQYSIRKRHVPDLDTDTGGQSGGSNTPNTQSTQSAQSAPNGQSGQNSQGQAPSPSAQKGQNSDPRGLSGGFTIRYFDFALGVLGLMVAGCLMKGCCFLKKKMF